MGKNGMNHDLVEKSTFGFGCAAITLADGHRANWSTLKAIKCSASKLKQEG